MTQPDAARHVVLGVAGGIAAYKAASLLRLLTESGHDVRVVPTRSALRFVGAPTWAALSGKPVSTEVWDDVHEVPHVRIGKGADLVVVAPATADLLAKAATGQADDLLTNTLLTARCPVLLVPAMHTEMWLHPATVANVETLRSRGVHVLDPASGRLTGADTGPGRLPEPEEILAACLRLLDRADGAGRRPHAGPRRPARGRQRRRHPRAARPRPLPGQPLLGQAGLRARPHGRRPAAPASRWSPPTPRCPTPTGVDVVRVGSALELQQAVTVAGGRGRRRRDGRRGRRLPPGRASPQHKIKKSHEDGAQDAPVIELVRNPDVLADLAHHRRRPGQVVVGFAAETGDATGDVLALGRAKLARKGCDLLVVNEVGAGKAFGTDDNTVTVLTSDGTTTTAGPASKDQVADVVWDAVALRLE